MRQAGDLSCAPSIDAQQMLARAEALCQQRGARLTDLRRRVLEIIWSSATPLGAYTFSTCCATMAAMVRRHRTGTGLSVGAGLIHRLASLNVFTGCRRPGSHHSGQFLICRDLRPSQRIEQPGDRRIAACRDRRPCASRCWRRSVEDSGRSEPGLEGADASWLSRC